MDGRSVGLAVRTSTMSSGLVTASTLGSDTCCHWMDLVTFSMQAMSLTAHSTLRQTTPLSSVELHAFKTHTWTLYHVAVTVKQTDRLLATLTAALQCFYLILANQPTN